MSTALRLNARGFATIATLVVFVWLSLSCRTTRPTAPDAGFGDSRKTDVSSPDTSDLRVNLAHLEHLYEERILPKGDTGGVVWIYAEAPDYQLIGDDDEGYTCVDDMARALVVYGMHHELYGDQLSRKRVTQLTRTITAMQAENGYFHNFLWPGDSLNTTYRTSLSVPDWWSWRALWALEWALSQNLLPATEAAFAKTCVDRLMPQVRQRFAQIASDEGRDTIILGVRLPNDLPAGGGADQSAELMLGLAARALRTRDTLDYPMLRGFAERLMRMQDADGRLLSWYQYYHAWGNLQAYALQVVGAQLGDAQMAAAGRAELDRWLPRYLELGRPAALEGLPMAVQETKNLDASSSSSRPNWPVRTDTFPQIAYGQRGFVWAAQEAFRQTSDLRYRELSQQALAWYAGQNLAQTRMYDPRTGRGYDGIISSTKINQNAGAESTIEALLSLLMAE